MSTQIPDGYELLAGRNKENAIKALATAEERGLAPELVRTTTDGYLVPLGDSEESDEKDKAEGKPRTRGRKATDESKKED